MPRPKEITADQASERLLSHVRTLVDFWDKSSRAGTQRDRLSGLAFSILSTLDGCSVGLPAFIGYP